MARFCAPGIGRLIGFGVATVVRGGEIAVRNESAQLARPIETDEHFAEKSIRRSRLAARLQALDRDLDDRVANVGGREWPTIEALGRSEQARSRDDVGVPGSPGQRLERDVGSRSRTGRHDRPGRQQLSCRPKQAGVVRVPAEGAR